jgi:ketosteroid isomerase-like protein
MRTGPLALLGVAVFLAAPLTARAQDARRPSDAVIPSPGDIFTCQPETANMTGPNTQKGKKTMMTKALLETYYKGFADKAGWETVISDDFKFFAGDMMKPDPVVGKQAYVQIIKRFSQLFTAMRVKEMMIDDDRAYVLANYDYVFPGGKAINGDVVELWKVKDGKLAALTIFFDTLTFERLTKPAPKS